MLRYLPGILLVQLVTGALVWVSWGSDVRQIALQAGIPALLVAFVTALWFASIGRADIERATTKLRLKHAAEREKLQINAEKTKAKIIEKSHREIRRNERSVGRKASFKVGLAFAAATAAGVLMLITELITFGLMTITTTMGGMGGYLLRGRQAATRKAADTANSSRLETPIEPPALPPPD